MVAVVVAMQCTPTPAGCYSDIGTRAIDIEIVSAEHMSSEICTDSCAGLGYAVSGVTGHGPPDQTFYCYCGISINPSAVPAPESECNVTCPNGAPVSCGGNYRMSLYNATNCDTPLPPPAQNLNGTACTQPETINLPFCNTSLTFAERTRDLVGRITLAEIGPQLTARNSPPIPRLGIGAYYWGANFVHGITNPVSGGTLCLNESCVTIWPSGPGLGASWNATAWNTMGAAAADEYRALNNANWGPVARGNAGMDGLNSWGPTINLIRECRWGRVQESFSEDPYFNGIAATNIVRGLQEGEDSRYLKVAATLKHFAVYSLEQYFDATDNFTYTRENINNLASPFDLSDSYFPHFQQAVSPVASGGGAAAGVMMAMNEVNSVPSLASSQLINQLRTWGGKDTLYIATDGGNMIDSMIALEPKGHSYCPYHAPPCTRNEGVTLAVQAGSDIADGSEYESSLFDTVISGNLTLGEAQQRLYYTLLIRMRLGLFDDLATQPYAQIGPERLGAPATRAAALLAAKESLVLLENDVTLPQIALPWSKTGSVPLTIIGFAANSTQSLISNYVSNQGCSTGGFSCYPNIAQSIEALGVNIADIQLGCSSASSCPPTLSAAAIAAASVPNRRILLVLGLSQNEEGEQKDREVTGLPAEQELFVNAILSASATAGNALAAVVIHGGAVSLPKLKVAGVPILDGFYPGPFGGEAIAAAIFGDYNPGGKLPYTVYDEPYATAVEMRDMRIAAIGRTYRYHSDNSPGGPPLWRFGTGKSYTKFTTTFATPPPSSLTLTPSSPSIPITLSITNTGNMDGDEVLQAYFVPISVSSPQPPFLPLRSLFAFKRVHVPRGTAVDVTINVNALLMPLTLSDGTRGPIDGEYIIIFSRGEGGQEISVNATLNGW